MLRITIGLLTGLIFGLGLVISGMANPAKVQNFLDLFGTFDPSLAFVMAAAVAVTFLGYRLVLRKQAPLCAENFRLPASTNVDSRLVIGPALFGLGWGLSGFCPGPAITSLSLMAEGTLIFVPAMLVGVGLARFVVRERLPARSETTGDET